MGNFINPSFLLWIVPLAAAPIVIHLLNRRRYRNVRWAAMKFLEAAFKRTNRRIRMENLILLLIRTAIMILIVLGVSRPVVTRGSALAVIGQEKRNLILGIDTSYSMLYREGVTETAFDKAKEIAKRIVSDLNASRGDTLTLLVLGERPEVLQERSVWVEKGLEDLAELEAGSGPADLEAAFLEILKIAEHPEMRTQTEIVLVSDFQRRDWVRDEEEPAPDEREPAPGDDATAPREEAEPPRAEATGGDESLTLRDVLAEITRKEIPVHLIDVGTEKTFNLGVSRFAIDDRAVGVRRPVRLEAEIANTGSEETSGTASLWIGDSKVATETIGTLGPGEKRAITFFHAFPTPGDAVARVEVDPEVKDQLAADDRRFLALEVLERIRILVVDGKAGEGGFLESETGYLKLALDPEFGTTTASEPLFSIEEGFDYDLGLKIFSEYDWIALANVREIPETKVRELVAAVRAGAGLLLFLGDQVDPAVYGERVFGDGDGNLLPGQLLEVRAPLDREATWDLVVSDFRHPVLRFFADETIRPLLTEYPKVRGFVRYDPGPEEEGPRVLARYSDPEASPALVEWSLGSGRVLLFTTSAGDGWSDLPRTPGFLPLVQEIGTYLAAADLGRKNVGAGEPFVLEFPRFGSNTWIELPTGERRRVELRPADENESRFLLVFNDTRRPGVYRIGGLSPRPGAEETAPQESLFAANNDPREGRLRRISEVELRTRFPEFSFRWLRDYTRDDESREAPREGEIWKYLLAAVLGLLFLEGFLAQFFGDYTKR